MKGYKDIKLSRKNQVGCVVLFWGLLMTFCLPGFAELYAVSIKYIVLLMLVNIALIIKGFLESELYKWHYDIETELWYK